MRRFAFIIHPLRFDDFARKYGFTRYLPPKLVEWAFKQVGPVMAGHVTGVRSPAGEELEGWLIGLPLTPRDYFVVPLRLGSSQINRGRGIGGTARG